MSNTKEYNAKYYQEHKAEIRERKIKRYKENPEIYKERAKQWVEANREKWNAYMRERRKQAKINKNK